MKRSARITLHPESLQHNLQQAKQLAPESNILAVIKANAYGHGSVDVAGILYDAADAFAVACVPEAVVLREAGIDKPMTVLQGFQNDGDLRIAEQLHLRLTVHDDNQLSLLDNYSAQSATHQFRLNLKIDSGMHRLGFAPERAASLFERLQNHPVVDANEVILMSHFASADEPENPQTSEQIAVFDNVCASLTAPHSIANSAGLLAWPASRRDWVRPGIMLYGSSPFADKPRESFDLHAAMTFEAPVFSVHDLKKGDSIGYAATWHCPEDMTVAVIGCGYADGYPRHASNGTPVWLNGKETKILGRVSMDMIVVDANSYDENPVRVGDMAELWGKNISVDRVAHAADTIAYEILCNAGNVRA